MSKRTMEFPKMPKSMNYKGMDDIMSSSQTPTSSTNLMNNVAKWMPLICAGAAIGVSIIALKEIQNVRKELKNENVKDHGHNKEHAKRLEIMEEQLKNLSDFITIKQNKFVPEKVYHKPPPPKERVIKNAHTVLPDEVKIVNENFDPNDYEEVEVTDDEN